MKLKIILLLIFILIINTFIGFAADELENRSPTSILLALDLLRGTSNGLELERAPTRLEASVMIVRLLGKEQLIKARYFPHPFKDVPYWGNPYVGYLYSNEIMINKTDQEFLPDQNINPELFLTVILRLLGYDDKQGDFVWFNPYDLASEIELIDNDMYNQMINGKFTRKDMFDICYNFLKTSYKESSAHPVESLISAGVIDRTLVNDYELNPNADYVRYYFVDFSFEENTHRIRIDKKTLPDEYKEFKYINILTLGNSNDKVRFPELSIDNITDYYFLEPYSIYDTNSFLIRSNELIYLMDANYNVIAYSVLNEPVNIGEVELEIVPYDLEFYRDLEALDFDYDIIGETLFIKNIPGNVVSYYKTTLPKTDTESKFGYFYSYKSKIITTKIDINQADLNGFTVYFYDEYNLPLGYIEINKESLIN